MATSEARKCKVCGTQLWSAVERDQAKCTRCLGAERPSLGERSTEGPKSGETQTPRRVPLGETQGTLDPQATSAILGERPAKRKSARSGETQTPPKVPSRAQQGTLDRQANRNSVGCKISDDLLAKLRARVEQDGGTQGQFIRRLLIEALR